MKEIVINQEIHSKLGLEGFASHQEFREWLYNDTSFGLSDESVAKITEQVRIVAANQVTIAAHILSGSEVLIEAHSGAVEAVYMGSKRDLELKRFELIREAGFDSVKDYNTAVETGHVRFELESYPVEFLRELK